MQRDTIIDPDATVNAMIARHPASIAVLNRLGIDTCCGGGETLRAAAKHSAIDLEMLTTALKEAVETP